MRSTGESIEAARYERLDHLESSCGDALPNPVTYNNRVSIQTLRYVYQTFALAHEKTRAFDSFCYHAEQVCKCIYGRFPRGFRDLHIERRALRQWHETLKADTDVEHQPLSDASSSVT